MEQYRPLFPEIKTTESPVVYRVHGKEIEEVPTSGLTLSSLCATLILQ